MRYPYRSRPPARVGRLLVFAALVFTVIYLSGCGLVADGVNGLRAIQLPAGKLYSPEFYQTATVEELKKAIGNRSLAGEFFTERFYASNTEGRGFLAELDGQIKTVGSVFVPMSSVEIASPLYPLEVAMRNTPYPEVIAYMLDAGAELEKVPVDAYVVSGKANSEIIRLLLARSSEQTRCRAFTALAGVSDFSMMDFALDLEGTNISCTYSEGHYTNYPLKQALLNRQTDGLRYLLGRGAVLPDNADERMWLLGRLVYLGDMNLLQMFMEKGLRTSEKNAKGKNELIRAALNGHDKSEPLLLLLARTVPLDAVNLGDTLEAACRSGSLTVLHTLLGRIGGSLPENPDIVLAMLGASLSSGDVPMFWDLIARGADCSQVDSSAKNRLFSDALWGDKDENVLLYLANRVPVDGRNGDQALRSAAEAGFIGPVRVLLQRGAVATVIKVHVPRSAEGDAIRALLKEKGIPV